MIGIIGSGTMGKGIAIEFAKIGKNVVLVSAQRHLSSKELIAEIDNMSKKNSDIDSEIVHRCIKLTNSLSDLSHCDYIIEAVSENLEIKRDVIKETTKYIKKDTMFSSNTSSLSIKDIFDNILDLRNVCGLHFFNPVHSMKLVEISYLDNTSDKVIEYAKKLAYSLNKEVVIVKNSPGFIVNRLLIPMINEASKILDEGLASLEDIDKAMKLGANHPIGPLKLSDLIGNDITFMILQSLKDKLNIDISKTLKDNVEKNKLGRKTKGGYYKYH